jgi:hypothetical protein
VPVPATDPCLSPFVHQNTEAGSQKQEARRKNRETDELGPSATDFKEKALLNMRKNLLYGILIGERL